MKTSEAGFPAQASIIFRTETDFSDNWQRYFLGNYHELQKSPANHEN